MAPTNIYVPGVPSIGKTRRRVLGGAGASGPQPLNIPAGASAVYSVQKLATWGGSCCRVFRTSDTAQLDIGFVNNQMDIASAVAFAGSSPVIVATWYDQSGNGNNATNATLTIAANPIIRTGNTGIVFDGDKVLGTRTPLLNIPTTLSLPRANFSMFIATKPSSGMGQNQAAFTPIGGQPIIQFSPAQANTTKLSMQADASNGLVAFYNNTTVLGTGSKTLPGVPTVIGLVSNGSSTVIYNDGLTINDAAMTAATMLGATIGQITVATGFTARFETYAVILYPTALSAGNISSVKSALATAFNTDATYTKQVIFCGDSITEASQAAELQTIERQAQAAGLSAKVYNHGMGGAKWADVQSLYTTFTKPLFNAGLAKNVIVVNTGINDFINHATAATVETAAQSFCTTARADGFKVLIGTVIPTTNPAHISTADDTSRQTYNTWLRANFNTFADGLIDYDNDPIMGTAAGNTANTTYFADGLHPTAAGYTSLVTNELMPALNAVL